VASFGITGGFSPGRVFGPVRGTSAGTVGVAGRATPRLVLRGAGAFGVVLRGAGVLADDDAVEGAGEGGVCAAVALHAAQPNRAATARASARRIRT
jgi:hypothetical protein